MGFRKPEVPPKTKWEARGDYSQRQLVLFELISRRRRKGVFVWIRWLQLLGDSNSAHLKHEREAREDRQSGISLTAMFEVDAKY